MRLTLLFAFLLSFLTLSAQEKFQIKDHSTQESVPFVKVIPAGKPAILADLDGYFSLDINAISSFQLKFLGYKDTTIFVSSLGNERTIYIQAEVEMLDAVVVLPGENPAHRIMDQVIANRKNNSPTENNAFQYESYSKFYFTMDPKALEKIPADTKDSNLLSLKTFFDSQYLFLLESSSTRKFMPPSRDKETITAYKVSGFKDPMFSTFANEMQSFSFYENQFQLLGKTYINPIALGGTRRYLFLLEDTTVVGNDTTFTISFRPRKGKNFDGLKGQLFINTNGFAVEKVISEPYEVSDNISIKVIQEYAFIEGKKWFPVKLSSELLMPIIKLDPKLNNSSIVGKGNTYISNIVLNPDLKKREFGSIAIETANDAGEKTEKDWDTTRFYDLNTQEKKTYQVIDSISKENKLEQKLMLLTALADGKIPLGYFNLDIKRLMNFNLYEGYRFGLGLETSKKLMKRATVGGYFGWATKDKAWKYGGFSEFKLYPKKDFKLRLVYQQDLLQRGGNEFRANSKSFNTNDLYQQLYVRNMEKQRLAEIILSGYATPAFKVALIGNYQRISFTEGYEFFDGIPLVPSFKTSFDLKEIGGELTWQLGEKVMQLGDNRVSMGSKYPKLAIKFTQGKSVNSIKSYNYSRLFAEISQNVSLRGVGKFVWMIRGSKTIGNAPLFLLQAVNGTGGNWRLSVPNSFETILPSAFFNDQQVSLFTRMTFLNWKTKLKWFAPQLSIHHAMGVGSMQNRTQHLADFKTMEKGYYESGIILDKLYISGFSTFGLGVFTNYGAYSHPKFEKNLTFKISLGFNI